MGNVSKVPVIGFKWVEDKSKLNEKLMKKFVKKCIKNHDGKSDIGYILEVDIKYFKDLHDLHSDLPFLGEPMKINECNKLVFNLHNKNVLKL